MIIFFQEQGLNYCFSAFQIPKWYSVNLHTRCLRRDVDWQKSIQNLARPNFFDTFSIWKDLPDISLSSSAPHAAPPQPAALTAAAATAAAQKLPNHKFKPQMGLNYCACDFNLFWSALHGCVCDEATHSKCHLQSALRRVYTKSLKPKHVFLVLVACVRSWAARVIHLKLGVTIELL